MNPLCDFALSYEPGDGKGGPDAYTPSFSGLTGKLIGYTGSTAETYAELFGYQFESLGDAEPLLNGDYNGDGIDDLRVRNGNDLAAVMVYTDGLEWKNFGSVPSDWKTSLAGTV